MKKEVYLCSPLMGGNDEGIGEIRGDGSAIRYQQLKRTRNEIYARVCLKSLILKGYLVVAPHLLYAQVLDDFDPAERELGIGLGLEELARCKALVLCPRYGISDGMAIELETAKKLNLPTFLIDEVPELGGDK
ncbi:DUF4406 domain-containing protein [Wolinella succinogenes]|uniref:DUF7768 domain-containing protein n=1 Tax=Wolinella succinogenes TaxID=844 RepID=UPI00067464D6|nr:DUF4406 domain-containing protein [Wolinella succinogenes]VEG82394.1 Uncharacterised protein [Wolinella succinogenes]